MNILNGIMFSPLPMSTLYGTTIMALLDDIFRTSSMVLTTLPLEPLHTSLKWLSLPHLSYPLPYAGHCLSLCSSQQYLHLLLVFNVFVMGLLSLCLISFCLIVPKFFASCKLLITAICTLWAFTFVSTFSLCMVIFSSHFVISLIIFASISSSFKPYINCSFSFLSISV